MRPNECTTSPYGIHQFIDPRYDDSIDKQRQINLYCKHCFKSYADIQAEKMKNGLLLQDERENQSRH